MLILNLRSVFVVCLLGQDDSYLKGALKSFLVIKEIYNKYTLAYPTLRHTVTHTHTHSALKGRGISHGLPRACLCCRECIATGNLTHHCTRGRSASAATQCSQPLAAPNLLSDRKQHPTHSPPTTVSVNYVDFFSNHLHASIHLVELAVNCHHPLRFQRSE